MLSAEALLGWSETMLLEQTAKELPGSGPVPSALDRHIRDIQALHRQQVLNLPVAQHKVRSVLQRRWCGSFDIYPEAAHAIPLPTI
jgi:hypothetical protein